MMYYRYNGNVNTFNTLRIFEKVREYAPLAKKTYGVNWESALDDTYFHVLNHYDESKGSLEGYITRIIQTIHRAKFSKEVALDVLIDLESSKEAKYDDPMNPCSVVIANEEDVEYNSNLLSCIKYLLPYFLKDYEVFYSKDSSDRKLSYKGLFDKYSAKVLYGAVNELSKYYNEAKYISNLSKSCHVRNFAPDRYKSSLDKTITYIGRIGDIIKCKAMGIKRKKYAYFLDLYDLLNKLYDMFYSDDGIAKVVICDEVVYCSLSGQFYYSKSDLFEALEREIIGSILALRTNLKVLNYVNGDQIIFSSTNEDEPNVILNLFKTGVYIPMFRLTISR